MGVLSGYLRLQIAVVTAVVLAIGALAVLTGGNEIPRLLALFALALVGFAALVVVFSLR